LSVFSFPLQRYKKNLKYANFVPISGDLQKPARSPPPISFVLSRASLRGFSFLALSRDIIPLDCVFFRGILFRFYFLLFPGNPIARLVCPFPRNYIPPAASCIDAASSALPHFLSCDGIGLIAADDEDF
jgi:hypothetical protein